MVVNAYDVQFVCRITTFAGVLAALAAAFMTFSYTAVVMVNMPGWTILIGFALALFHGVPIGLFVGFILRDPENQRFLSFIGLMVAAFVLALLGWYFSSDPTPNLELYGPYAAEVAALTLVSIEALFRKKDYL